MRIVKRSLILIVLAVVVLVLVGALYQALSVRREKLRFPAPGRLISVGDGADQRKLHLVCLGQGEPTVVFEPGAFMNALSLDAVRRELSVHTRVCSYDRMGMGWSDPGPGVISVGMLADDLHHLTKRAGLQPPFILVPSSFGGLTVEMFARRHPEQTAGLVFVDAANSAMIDTVESRFSPTELSALCLAEPAARFGVLRLLDPFGLRDQQSEGAERSASRLYRVEPMQAICSLVRGLRTTREEFRAAPPMPSDIPLRVLIHERPNGFIPNRLANLKILADRVASFDSEWIRLQQRFARSSSRGTWTVVPGSNHLIAADQPHAVAAAVLEVLGK